MRAARGRRVSLLEELSPWLGNSTPAKSCTSNNIWTAPSRFNGEGSMIENDTELVRRGKGGVDSGEAGGGMNIAKSHCMKFSENN